MFIPNVLLKQLYTRESLEVQGDTVYFEVKNRLKEITIDQIYDLKIGDYSPNPDEVTVESNDQQLSVKDLNEKGDFKIALGQKMRIGFPSKELKEFESYPLTWKFLTKSFGRLTVEVEDTLKKK